MSVSRANLTISSATSTRKTWRTKRAAVGHRINRSGHEGCQQQEQQFVLCKPFNKNYK